MKFTKIYFLTAFALTFSFGLKAQNKHYITNQTPLINQPYTALPLGAIKPQGMLLKMLEIQRDGLTGNIDSAYSIVCGDNNGWLGGTGDGWERGPYWLDGLVPLAYILDDENLKAKAQKWIEWSINNQMEDGYFGPQLLPEGYQKIKGTQQGMRQDYWPKMVMLKVLQQYYTATNDERVIKLMTNYFHFLHKELPSKPLGHYTWWAEQRGGDNLAIVYWLYNIKKEPWLLELAETIYKQTTPWTEWFSSDYFATINNYPQAHCVNVAMGVKTPVVYYQQNKDSALLKSVKAGLSTIKKIHGFANGMYGGDERMHGNDPTTGSELCSAVEIMYSFENNLPITGDVYYADYLEKIAYNVLPTQHDDHFNNKQYFQQANQVQCTYHRRNFFNDGYGRIVYGLLTGYPCCTTNMHQGWPKFVQNLWFATADNGLAALVYGPSEVKAKVADGTEVQFTETTNYPFSDKVKFVYNTKKKAEFALHLRIPQWCNEASVTINGTPYKSFKGNQIAQINRTWKKDDAIELHLPMTIRKSTWAQQSIAIERGPLLYALRIEEKWEKKEGIDFKEPHWEVYPQSAWNYGLLENAVKNNEFTVNIAEEVADMPWNLANAPISITTKACKLEHWTEYNHSAGTMPRSTYPVSEDTETETIQLIPYGCSTLRISQFPVVRKQK